MKRSSKDMTRLPSLLLIAGAMSAPHVRAAEPAGQDAATVAPEAAGAVDEVVVTGRSLDASERLVEERLNDAAVVDTIGAEAISRLGDSTVAASLRRIPGLSLVSDKFVYIRGLGERYSSTSLNGTSIPSPDLTRNVIPLDIFPTSVVDSIRVQKAWSPDVDANFGGGNVNIRTKAIPDRFEMSFEVSTGGNTETSGKGLTYAGGDDDHLGEDDGTRALPGAIVDALQQYQGDVGIQSVGAAVNRALGLELNRDMDIERKSISPDLGLKANVGNRFLLGDDWTLGFQVGGTYDTGWRKAERVQRDFSFPDERTDTEAETTRSVNLSSTGNLGLAFTEDHSLNLTSLFVRSTDDETAIRDFFNENAQISDGRGFRDYRFKYEQRSLVTHQLRGSHVLGDDTRDALPFLGRLFAWVPRELGVNWSVSESKATTDMPNELSVGLDTITDPVTGAVLSETVTRDATAATYKFTDLEDRVKDYGWEVSLPLEFGLSRLELKGGSRHQQKARTYRQSEFSLGTSSPSSSSVLTGSISEVFSDANILDPANNFVFQRQGSNIQSFLAATMTDSVFGMADWTYDDRWRVTAGARWENYRQAAVDWNPYGYSQANPQVTTDPAVLERGTFAKDDIYPAVSLTYMSDWLAETFQLRFGWSETTVRPDLREVTDASYTDPITNILTRGNSGVVPADVANYDIRAEWRFYNGDNLSVTLFDKRIDNPIEFFETAASDTTTARQVLNAESAYVRGVEFEGLKRLDFLGSFGELMFLQGNLTIQDSELTAGAATTALANPTNPVRKLAGASDYVANVTLGFDSLDGKHTASLIYNVFGERLYLAGRNGAPDGFEQPFHSVDVTYSWYPSDSLTVKAKVQNLLQQSTEITKLDVVTFGQEVGMGFSLGATWAF